MKNFRLMMVILSLNTGGAEKLLVDILKNLNKEMIDDVLVVSVFPSSNTFLERELSLYGIKIKFLNVTNKTLKSYLIAVSRLRRIIDEFKPDIIHSHLKTIPFLLPIYFFTGRKIVKIHTVHNLAEVDANDFPTKISNYIAFRFLKTIPVAITLSVKQSIVNFYGNKVKPLVIYNGIETKKFKPKIRLKPKEMIMLNVGRLVEQKGQRFLIQAFAEVKKRLKNLKLWIVGTGSLEEELKSLSIKLGLENDVVFFGERSDVSALMDQVDVFVLTSKYEGFGLVLVEAMASGVPIVACNIPPVIEILQSGEYGVIYESDNVNDFVEKISYLFNDSNLYSELSRKGILRASEFDISRTVKEYEQLYLTLLENRGGKSTDEFG